MHKSTVIFVMNLVSDLDLPVFDYSAPDFSAVRYHQQLAQIGQQGWLAKSPLAYIELDRDSSEFFLRSRAAAPTRRGRGHLRNRQAPDHLVGLSPAEPGLRPGAYVT